MNYFSGRFLNSVDIKGRVAIPHKFRKLLGASQIVITKGLDGCLYSYTVENWEKLLEKLENLSQWNSSARKLRIFFAGNADYVDIDKQGRINLNSNFIKLLKLDNSNKERKVLFVGDIDKIQIWNPEDFDQFMGDVESDINKIAEELSFSF